jgi:hypothetical protein
MPAEPPASATACLQHLLDPGEPQQLLSAEHRVAEVFSLQYSGFVLAQPIRSDK